MKASEVIISVLALFWTAGCGSESKPEEKAPPGGGGTFDTSKPPSADCTEAAKLVYVISAEQDLYSFAPDATTFVKIGPVRCPSTAVPSSMAIDRSGTAWVNYTDGAVFKVSTTDASCAATSFAPRQHGFARFGMAFATNGADTTEETLYVSGVSESGTGLGFGSIDRTTLQLSLLGDYSDPLAGKAAELTGTGDGRLFGFFTTVPEASLAKIDRAKGATSDVTALAGVRTGNAWAFSFWGGDFWFYTSEGGAPSKVTRLTTSNGKTEIVVAKEDVGGFRIVGAGVSTCAPLTAPR